MQPEVKSFFDPATFTFTYVVYDEQSKEAVVIDPVMDFDQPSGQIDYRSANIVLEYIKSNGLVVKWVLETHAHADHLTAAQYFKEKTGADVAIGAGIAKVQTTFKDVFNLPENFKTDGSQFDRCFTDGEQFSVGKMNITVLETPGHTNDSVTYLIGDAAFIGDTMFHPEVGTARCDFPGGDASMLYSSIQRILSLPENTRLFLCHDYPSAGREPVCQVSIAEQRQQNIHVHDGNSEQDFISFRTSRDAQLAVPKLLYPSVQINVDAGHIPEPEANGKSYMKAPIVLPKA